MLGNRESIKSSREDAYNKYNANLHKERLRVLVLLSIFFVSIFGFLDWIVYPSLLLEMLVTRLIANLILILIIFLLGKQWFSQTKILSIAWNIVLVILINVLLLFTKEGASSSYYAGLSLAIIASAALLPWIMHEMLFICFIMLVSYLCTFFLHSYINGTIYDSALLINNLFFLISTSFFCVLSSFINSKLRFKEFCLNRELEEKNEKLLVMDQMKSQFFANVSHELRTPLTLIIGPIQDILNRKTEMPENIRNIFITIEKNGLRLLKLVNDLLDIIRLEEGKTNLKLNSIELGAFVNGLVDSMQYLANLQKILLVKEIATKEVVIKADNNALEKIVLNLLNNAIKFTPKGGTIKIRVGTIDNHASIEIEDNGIGMKESDLPFIFDRFHQVDSSSTRQYQGTGLGLALVKELTELQNGQVKVKSQINVGTVFSLEFPLFSEVEACIEELEESKVNAKDNNIINMHKMAERVGNIVSRLDIAESDSDLKIDKNRSTVLVIDDEPDMRNYIVNLLREENYRILQAKDGETGLKMAVEYKPDLVVLDLMLPKIDGLEICRTLKADSETSLIKIIMLTARIDETAKITALYNGADDFLIKPFSGIELKGRTGNLLQNKKLQAEVYQRNEELKEMLGKLQSTQSQLIQSEKLNALGNLAAGLLHEINNPLNYTITALQLIKMDPAVKSDEDLKDTVKDIEEGMNRIKLIITDLRAFAYPSEADKKAKISVSDIAASAIRFTSHECKDIKVICNIPDNIEAYGSKTHIVQVLVNLITNASKAIAKIDKSVNRPGEIIIGAEVSEDRVIISVSDNGCGMSEEVLRQVFDPFFTTSEVGKGMGLGLSVSHTIIKSHGGHFTATSKLGEGSTFYFDLPLKAAILLLS